MELTEFAALIASGSTNTAKNTLSYLIGNGLNNQNWSKGLAQLYKSFPEDVKTSTESKKEFFPVILKYFQSYSLTLENISIYKEYEFLFSAKNKEDIKKFNPGWSWDEEPEIIFKNALAFTYAIPTKYNESKFDFIRKYENQLELFMVKQKDKIFKHFTSQRVWENLMREDYYEFFQFCKKYDFDRIEILKETITPYKNLYNNEIFSQENFNFYLDDLIKVGKENLKIINDFYPQSSYQGLKRNNSCSVYSVLLECIGNHQYKNAMKWLVIFDEEINEYSKLYGVDNLHTSFNFKQLLNKQIKTLKDDYRYDNMESFILENILKNENWFKFMDSFELFEHLSEKLLPREKVKPTKI